MAACGDSRRGRGPTNGDPDASAPDARIPDGGVTSDAARPDANTPDSNIPDANIPDRNVPDAMVDADLPGRITVSDIQRGLVAEGTSVTLTNVIVTGLASRGIWVQDPTGGTSYAGLRIFMNSPPTVVLHDRVDVTGTYIEYFEDSELDMATVTRRGAGAPITPVRLSATAAASESMEGMLVEINGAVTTDFSYDCFQDDPSCSDFGLWEIGGSSGVVAYDFIYQDSNWLDRVGSPTVIGVMSYRWGRRRILPRTSADLF